MKGLDNGRYVDSTSVFAPQDCSIAGVSSGELRPVLDLSGGYADWLSARSDPSVRYTVTVATEDQGSVFYNDQAVCSSSSTSSAPPTTVYIVLNMEDILQHPAVFTQHEDAIDYIKRKESVDENTRLVPRNDHAACASFMVLRDGRARRSNYFMFTEII